MGADINDVALVSATDQQYTNSLIDMIKSLGSFKKNFDIRIIDLGLDEISRQTIRNETGIDNIEFLAPEWPFRIPRLDETPEYKKVFLSKPFIPEFFPQYRGFLWVDADVWFQDPTAIDDYIDAAQATGAAFSFESHPLYRSTQKVRYNRILGKIFCKGIKDYLFNNTRKMFGQSIAIDNGINPVLNSGIFYMNRKSPIWKAWQDAIRSANLRNHHKYTQICDQTCLQVAVVRGNFPHATMPATHNWLPKLCVPPFDPDRSALVDPMYPHPRIKVIHLAGAQQGERFTVRSGYGTTVSSALRWSDFPIPEAAAPEEAQDASDQTIAPEASNGSILNTTSS